MKLQVLTLGVTLMIGGCAAVSPVAEKDRTLQFGCDDAVFIGRLKNGLYEDLDIQGDVLGHGLISATLHVRRVLRGPAMPSVVPVQYIAHTFMREDREFMFVAKRHSGKPYEIVAFQAMSLRPRLANTCT